MMVKVMADASVKFCKLHPAASVTLPRITSPVTGRDVNEVLKIKGENINSKKYRN